MLTTLAQRKFKLGEFGNTLSLGRGPVRTWNSAEATVAKQLPRKIHSKWPPVKICTIRF